MQSQNSQVQAQAILLFELLLRTQMQVLRQHAHSTVPVFAVDQPNVPRSQRLPL